MPAPLVIPSSDTASGIALTRYREELGPLLGLFAATTVTSAAASLEATRTVLSSALASDAAKPDHWDGHFVYVRDGAQAGSQRRVIDGSFQGPQGALLVDYPFDAALAIGTTFEVSVLPAGDWQGIKGLNDAINRALDTLPVVSRVAITSDGLARVSLANYAWPIKGVRGVYDDISATDDTLIPTSQRWSFENDAEGPYVQLTTAYSSGTVFYLELLRSARTRIRQNGAWGDSSTGLENEDDEALYDARTVALAALPIATARLARMAPRGSKQRAELQDEADRQQTDGNLTRFYQSFKGSGAQRAGAVDRSTRWTSN
jgi:hypothetical protein